MSTLKVNAITNLSNEARYAPVSMEAKTTTSGTYHDFTGIPSWVKKITVVFQGLSTNGSSSKLIQLGTSGGFTTSGYVSTSGNLAAGGNVVSSTAGMIINSGAAADIITGHMTITLITGNTWISSSSVKLSTTYVAHGGGEIALSGTLTQVRVTTVNGTDTFDAGTINVIYE